jgi:hypothetical protein
LPENIEPQTTSILPGRWFSPVKFSVIIPAKVIQRLETDGASSGFFDDNYALFFRPPADVCGAAQRLQQGRHII